MTQSANDKTYSLAALPSMSFPIVTPQGIASGIVLASVLGIAVSRPVILGQVNVRPEVVSNF